MALPDSIFWAIGGRRGDAEGLWVFGPYIPDPEFVLDDLTPQSREGLYQGQLTDAAWLALTLLRGWTPREREPLYSGRAFDGQDTCQLAPVPNLMT